MAIYSGFQESNSGIWIRNRELTYKTGYVAKTLSIDVKTVSNWVDRFSSQFSLTAQGEQGSQRQFEEHDLIVLNTIDFHRNRKGKREDWMVIHQILENGEYILELPQDTMLLNREPPVQQLLRLSELAVELKNAEKLLGYERDRNQQHEQDKEVLREEIKNLQREMGKVEGRAEAKIEEYERKIRELQTALNSQEPPETPEI